MMVTRHCARVMHSVKRKVAVQSKKLVMHDDRQAGTAVVRFKATFGLKTYNLLHIGIMHGFLKFEGHTIGPLQQLHDEIQLQLCSYLLTKFPSSGESNDLSGLIINQLQQLKVEKNDSTKWIHAVIEAHQNTTSPLTEEQKKALLEFSKIIEPFRDKLTGYKPPNPLKGEPAGEEVAQEEMASTTSLEPVTSTSEGGIPTVKTEKPIEDLPASNPTSSSSKPSNGTEPIIPSALSKPLTEDQIPVAIKDPIPPPSGEPNPQITSHPNLPIDNPLDHEGCPFCNHDLSEDEVPVKSDTIRSTDTPNSQLPNSPSRERRVNPLVKNKVNSSPLIFFFASLVLAKMTLLLVVFKKFLNPSQAATQNFNKTNNYSSQINQLQQSLNGLTALKGKSQ